MELVASRCPQCMGEVRPADDGMHAQCIYCGAVYLLPKDQQTKPKKRKDAFDVSPVIDRFIERHGTPLGVSVGEDLKGREALARKELKVPKKHSQIRLAFDASPSGRFARGLAITDEGISIVGDEGDKVRLLWEELPDYDYAYRRGYLVVAGERISTPDGEPIAELLNDIMEELYGLRSPEPDIERTLREALAGRERESSRVVWGERVGRLEEQARDNFDIDADEDVYLVLDATSSGSCKKGLAFCSSGIFMRDDEKDTSYAAWRRFDTWGYSFDGSVLSLGGYVFETDAGNLMVDAMSAMMAELFGVGLDTLPKGSDFPTSTASSGDTGDDEELDVAAIAHDVADIAGSVGRSLGSLFGRRRQ